MWTEFVLVIIQCLLLFLQTCQGNGDKQFDKNEVLTEFDRVDTSMPRDDIACSRDTQPRILTDYSGSFTSPNYPGLYPHGSNCRWLIKSLNTTVSLSFTELYTEGSNYDSVRVYNGNTTSAYLLGDFSGRYLPPPTGIHSTVPEMLVVFSSDSTVAYAGFNATYVSSDYTYEPDPCSPFTRPLVLAEFEGTFQSNGFPVAYANNANCQWLIISQMADGIVQIDFDVFSTEVQYDYVRVYDGNNNLAPLIGQLNGNPPISSKTFQSSQQFLFIQFTTDGSITNIGFNGTYKSLLRPTTTAFPPGLCGTNLHVSPSEATVPPTHDLLCHLDKVDTNYLNTYCIDLIQNLPGIGNADELIKQGGNFGCYLTASESFEDANSACYDNYQWLSRLGTCAPCTRLSVCIRFG